MQPSRIPMTLSSRSGKVSLSAQCGPAGRGYSLAPCHGMSCFVMVGGEIAVSGRIEGAGPLEPVEAVLPALFDVLRRPGGVEFGVVVAASAALPDAVQWRQKASWRVERATVGSMIGMAAPSFRFGSTTMPSRQGATLIRAYPARAPAPARARHCAGAVRAPDCACARRAQDAPRLSAESGSFRTGPARAGSGSGCRLPRTHHITDFPALDQK